MERAGGRLRRRSAEAIAGPASGRRFACEIIDLEG
jgi:hypothetical protein